MRLFNTESIKTFTHKPLTKFTSTMKPFRELLVDISNIDENKYQQLLHQCIQELSSSSDEFDELECMQSHDRQINTQVTARLSDLNNKNQRTTSNIESSLWSIDIINNPSDLLTECDQFHDELMGLTNDENLKTASEDIKKLTKIIQQSIVVIKSSWNQHYEALSSLQRTAEKWKTAWADVKHVSLSQVQTFKTTRDATRRSNMAKITRWKRDAQQQWNDKYETFGAKLSDWVEQVMNCQETFIALLLSSPNMRNEVSIFRDLRKQLKEEHQHLQPNSSMINLDQILNLRNNTEIEPNEITKRIAVIMEDWNHHMEPLLPCVKRHRKKLKNLIDSTRKELSETEKQQKDLEIKNAKITEQKQQYFQSVSQATAVDNLRIARNHELIKQGIELINSKLKEIGKRQKELRKVLLFHENLYYNTRITPPSQDIFDELCKEEYQLMITKDMTTQLMKTKKADMMQEDKQQTSEFLSTFIKRMREAFLKILHDRNDVIAEILSEANHKSLESRETSKLFSDSEFLAQVVKQDYLKKAMNFRKCAQSVTNTYRYNVTKHMLDMVNHTDEEN